MYKTRRTITTLAIALLLTITGCTSKGGVPDPPSKSNTPEQAAADLAKALTALDVSNLDLSGIPAAEANTELKAITAGLDFPKPTVTTSAVQPQDSTAAATLTYTWAFPDLDKGWTYETTAQLVREDKLWKTSWQPSLVHPDLDGSNRLVQRRTAAERGEILDGKGDALASKRDVWRIGIDKTAVKPDQATASAVALAKLVKIDQKAFAAKVKAAGAEAFVEAITYRADSRETPSTAKLDAIKGATKVAGTAMLAPTRDFAGSILGTVGEASKEIIDASEGKITAGDQVGLSGLQLRYDRQLRGVPGVEILLAAAKTTATASPSPSASPSAGPAKSVKIFERQPTGGTPLKTTFDTELQAGAEKILSTTRSASALVAIRPSTGAVLTAADGGPGGSGQSTATVGQYPPGSTFKVATTLALLRSGLKPDSSVDCPATVTVDGRRFKNYSDYPSSSLGKINLRTAVAQSCNTAFISERNRLKNGDLAEAASSLGLGTDYDVGFGSFFGSVPQDKTKTGQAASMIGQAKVQASPLAMAAVAASVAEGKTVIPHLIDGLVATSKAKPLTAAEAKQLSEMLRGVVTEGSGRSLAGLDGGQVIAKTGTAEYGTKEPLKTHAWMIAAQGDLAVAVFVTDGTSGSQTAGPLLKEFLQDAN